VAFRAWKQKMLPLLIHNKTPVYDFSKADPAAYHGGIVDVYRPYLEGKGYYYDVNSPLSYGYV
jgi:hypothetical protein